MSNNDSPRLDRLLVCGNFFYTATILEILYLKKHSNLSFRFQAVALSSETDVCPNQFC
jgi:hypothetical protein